MVKRKNIAVCASGGGSDMQSLIDACERGEVEGEVKLLIASKPGIGAIERAARHGIAHRVFEKKAYPSPEAMFDEVVNLFASKDIDLVVLAGYLTILTPNIVRAYKNRILNIHPSLIPAFCGMNHYGLKVHEAVLAYGCKMTGATVHFVDEGADTGPIVAQCAVPVLEDDTPQTLQQRVLAAEHTLLPHAAALFCADRLSVKGRRVTVAPQTT